MTANVMQPFRRLMRDEEPEWLVWVLVAVMLAIGGIVGAIVMGRTELATASSLSFRYPAGWVSMAGGDPFEMLHVAEPFETAAFPANASVRQMPVTEVSTTAQTLGDLAFKWTNRQAQELLGYKVLNIAPVTVHSQEAIEIEYVYVAEPPMAGPDSIPVVAHGADVLLRRGDTLTVITFSADAAAYPGLATTWGRILASLKLN